MPETPNPTLAELIEADALTNGDIGLAQSEIIRRLQLLLPDWIAHKNLEKGWSGPDAIRVPTVIQSAPAVLSDDFLNTVLVGVSVETSPQGIGGAFRNTAQVVISSVEARIEDPQQVATMWARAEAIRTCLYPFLSGCRTPGDQLAWRMLEPKGYGPLPGDWAQQYSGSAVHYHLVQSPR
jgi:hypothetical protein